MVFIPGVNNGQSGFGMHRALFPSNMGGPFGQKGNSLPNAFASSTSTVSNPRNYGKRKSKKRTKKPKKLRKSKKSKRK